MSKIWAILQTLPFAPQLFGLYLKDTSIVKDGLALEEGQLTFAAFLEDHSATLQAIAGILEQPANWASLVKAFGDPALQAVGSVAVAVPMLVAEAGGAHIGGSE